MAPVLVYQLAPARVMKGSSDEELIQNVLTESLYDNCHVPSGSQQIFSRQFCSPPLEIVMTKVAASIL